MSKSNPIVTAQLGEVWCADFKEAKFLKTLAPIFTRAAKEQRLEEFFENLVDLWNDRFQPVASYTVWRKAVHTQLIWAGFFLGAKHAGKEYDDWPRLMTIHCDRLRRRVEYITHVNSNIYLEDPQYDDVFSAREFRALQMDKDEFEQISSWESFMSENYNGPSQLQSASEKLFEQGWIPHE
ncbi:hypothetical protein C0992_012841 [Termitomyces sp. T32_za158]|nr:hypothetical protein C0992_012841 [Termitomyces sp. T32_za158]